MPQSAETELLLLCARPGLDDEAVSRIRTLVRQGADWPFVLRLADHYRTTGLLSRHLSHHAADLLDDELQAELQRYHLDSTRRNLVLVTELLRLLDLLSAAGIQAVPFKGVVSAVLIYGDMATRASGDIDLLVRPGDHAAAERLLLAQGYRVQVRYDDAMQSVLEHEQRQISIDLHWGIPPQTPRLDTDRLWENLSPVELAGRPVMTFSACDTLLVTANNAVKQYWRPSLHQLSDIAALTGTYTQGDWQAAFSRARTLGCQRMLVAALLLAHRLLDSPLPAAGPMRLFRHPGIARVVDEVEDHLFSQTEAESEEAAMQLLHHRAMTAYYLTLIDSPSRRWSARLRWAIKPNNADRAFFRLPDKLSALYVVLRPLRLLIKRR